MIQCRRRAGRYESQTSDTRFTLLATAKKSAAKPKLKAPKSEAAALTARIAKAEGVSAAEATLRALRDYAERVAPPTPAPAAKKAEPKSDGGPVLPKRIFLSMAGRPPVEVVNDVTILGSSKRCDIWINQPHVETNHARIVRDGERYFIEDLNTERGTTYEGQPVKRRELEAGDDYVLAGYVNVHVDVFRGY